jgi:alkylhydroperoxidase family enzyme
VLGLTEEIVSEALADWRTAPLEPRLKAAFAYLEKLVLTPQEITVDDIEMMRAAGLCDEAIEEAAYVTYLFSVMDRLADSFDFDIPKATHVSNTGKFLFNNGYKLLRFIR